MWKHFNNSEIWKSVIINEAHWLKTMIFATTENLWQYKAFNLSDELWLLDITHYAE